MFSTNTFVALLVFAAPFLVRADVDPTIPAPGAVYTEGSPCPIAWAGDTSSTTLWKNMAIELMSGSNLDMKFITTVATAQDGTVSGQFSYPCPQVTPNAAIYFYQFTAPGTTNLTWTGRFIIAPPSGVTTPPANSTQPDGSNIPWGDGSLDNPSDAVPPPPFASAISLSSTLGVNSNSSSSSASVVTSSTTGSVPAGLTGIVTSSSPAITLSTSQSASQAAQSSNTSGAMTGVDIRVLSVAAAAAATLALSFVW